MGFDRQRTQKQPGAASRKNRDPFGMGDHFGGMGFDDHDDFFGGGFGGMQMMSGGGGGGNFSSFQSSSFGMGGGGSMGESVSQ